MAMASDESWADVARKTREALRLVGYEIIPLCLPDEPSPCGISFALHAVSHFAALKAVADHQFLHLGPHFMDIAAEIFEENLVMLHAQCPDDVG